MRFFVGNRGPVPIILPGLKPIVQRSFLRYSRAVRVFGGQSFGISIALLTGCALLLLAQVAAAQTPGYADQLWQVSDGLPNTQVRAIHQTKDGFLWVGTVEGLAKFDGLTFATVERRSVREMIRQYYLGIAEGPDGSIWFSNGHGLSRHANGKVIYYGVTNGLPSPNVLTVFCDQAGDILAGTMRGVRKFQNGKFEPLVPNDSIGASPVRAILQDQKGSLWFGCSNGLFRLQSEKFVRQTAQGRPLPAEPILSMAEGTNGSIWVGTTAGLTRIDASGITNFTVVDGLLTNIVRSLCMAKDGTLWVGTSVGLQRLDHGQLPFVRQSNSFSAEYDWTREFIYTIFEDAEENIWVGCNHGLMRLKRERFKVYSTREGLPSRLVNSVLQDHLGRVWVGTAGGIARIEGDQVISGLTVTNDDHANQLPKRPVLSLLEDDQGDMWFGTFTGVYRMKTNALLHYTAAKSKLADDTARSMLQLTAKSYWIGNSNGLTRYRFQLFTNFAAKVGLSFTGVRALAEGKEKRLWVGSEEGVTVFKGDTYKRFTMNDGLSSERVNALYVDKNETLWIGTENGGLDRLRNGRVVAITPAASGLFSERIYSIIEDDSGNLWMGSRRGIFRASKQDLDAFADGRSNSVPCVAYGKEEGLRNTQCTGNSQPAAWKGKDGRLWFATVDGVAMIDARNLIVNRAPPRISVQKIVVDGQAVQARPGENFRPGRGNVEFEYTGICLQSPEKIRFQYRLEGVDSDWVEAGGRRSATYANLPPGDYRFLIRAGNNDGFWTPMPATFPFTLTPHFYQRTAFYVGTMVLLALAVVGLHLMRVRRHEVQKKELAALVAKRTEHLEAAIKSMETFTYSMAHDLRGPLRTIRSMTSLWIDEYRDRFDATSLDYAERIQAAVQRMDDLMRDLLVYGLVAHSNTTLEKVDLKHIFEAVRKDLQSEIQAREARVETTPEAPAVVANPLLLRQVLTNLLTNAIKFVPPQIKPEVRLHAERDKNSVRILVEDNGIGIQPKYRDRIFGLFERLDNDKKYPGTGVGLAIVQKAVERMGGKVGVESEPGKGSCFWVDLPAA
jgi:ligand-binding sensor domain-containing protein/signal transduction histidine kinase